MGNLLYVIAIASAAYFGFSQYEWYFIFVASAVMSLGHFIIRLPQIYSLSNEKGPLVYPQMLAFNTLVMAVVTGPIFFVASLFN